MSVQAKTFPAPAFEELTLKALAGLCFLLLILGVAEYDTAGRQTYEMMYNASAYSRIVEHTYNPSGANAGLRDTTTDQRGVTFSHAYDDFRRPESITAAGSLPEQNQSIAWTYDNRGIPETITQTGGGQPDSTITRSITPYGQIGNESVAFDGGTTSFSQTWDGAGRRVSLESGMGFQPMFQHNAAGQMTSVTVGGNAYNSYFTTAGLLSSRSNPFRTQTVTDRDGAGRILTQTVSAGSTTPLSETQAWLDDGRLDTYSAVRDGANAWNESRDYGYDARGQVLTETFAPGPETTATLNYTFSTNKLGIRTKAEVNAGGATNWYVNATTVNSLARVTQFSDNTGTRTVPTSGASFGAASVKLEVDGVPGPSATHPGWQDATGSWTADLQLTPGLHTLTARGVHPSGWLSDPATSTFTVTGTPQTMTPAFDGMGNVTSRTWSGGKAQTLTWDAFGRLTKIVQTGVEPFTWTAAFDGLGRRLRTTHTPSGGNAFVVNSSFDPQAEFLEVGININGAQNWRINGPDLNGAFGALNGTGGFEAVISPTGTTGTINDAFGNVVASVGVNNTVTWSPVKVGSYGPLPQYETKTLESGASLIEASTWRTRRADPTGLVNMGARHLGQKEGQFVSADPLGHASSWSLYDFSNGDGVNNFDRDGRLATGFSSGWSGTQSSSSSNSWAYNFGLNSGATNSGFYSGLGEGAVNIGIGVKDTAVGAVQSAWAFTGGAIYNATQGQQTIYGALGSSAYSLATSGEARSAAWNSITTYGYETFTDTDNFSQRVGGGSAVTLMTLGAGKIAEGLRTAGSLPTLTRGTAITIGEDLSSAAGTRVWRNIPEGHAALAEAEAGVIRPRGSIIDEPLDVRALMHDTGDTAGSGLSSWSADQAWALRRQQNLGGIVVETVAPEGSIWFNASGAHLGSPEAQVLVPGTIKLK